MPHSSGGGSHSGGHHSGSHHSGSHGGSGRSRRHASSYFKGARHYVYYKNKKPVHFYSDVEITEEYIKKRKKIWNLARIAMGCFYVLLFISVFFTGIYVTPHKLEQECIDENQIIDTTDMMTSAEEDLIYQKLAEFREQTGISVTLLTVNDEDWNSHFITLEKYAFDYYVTHLHDERNWLLVYSEPIAVTDFNNWKWEGMQGNDTDPVLTGASTDKFTSAMHKNITKDGFSKAVIETFDYYNGIVMKPSLNLLVLVLSLLFIAAHGGIIFFVLWLFLGSNIKIDEKAVELANPQYSYIEDTCNYCGGLYIHGIHTSCPHCGGALDPLDRPIIIENPENEINE